jgi:hypothetical protein
MKDKRKAYEEKFDAQLKEWSAKTALLKAKAENAKAGAKIDYHTDKRTSAINLDGIIFSDKEAR